MLLKFTNLTLWGYGLQSPLEKKNKKLGNSVKLEKMTYDVKIENMRENDQKIPIK